MVSVEEDIGGTREQVGMGSVEVGCARVSRIEVVPTGGRKALGVCPRSRTPVLSTNANVIPGFIPGTHSATSRVDGGLASTTG
jgi:hypothetical protein